MVLSEGKTAEQIGRAEWESRAVEQGRRTKQESTAKVYRELQVLYREIGLQGSHIYRDLSCVILLVIIRLILYKIKGIIGKS